MLFEEILTICSPSTFAIFFICGTASISVWMPILPASYPVVWVAEAALPAIVPPVARMRTPGRSAARDAPQAKVTAAAIRALWKSFIVFFSFVSAPAQGKADATKAF